jgi:hypothetical protein
MLLAFGDICRKALYSDSKIFQIGAVGELE